MIETTVSIYILPTRVRSQIITLTQQIHYLRSYFLIHRKSYEHCRESDKKQRGAWSHSRAECEHATVIQTPCIVLINLLREASQ